MIRRLIYLVGFVAIVAFGWFYFFNKNSKEYNLPKQEALKVSEHSEAFHQSLGNMMTDYYAMTEAFVKWDTNAVNQKSADLMLSMNEMNIEDLKKDSLVFETALIYQSKAKEQLRKLVSSNSLADKRVSLNLLTPTLYDFLRIIKYDNDKVYLLECPMAFNDEESGFWLNKTSDVRNPYLGTSHPKYRKTMLECGLAKDTINFLSHNTGNN